MFALRTPPTRRWAPAALLAAPVLALTLAACGPDAAPTASTGGPVTSSSANGGSSGQATGNANAERDAYDLELAQCIREQGVDVKDPAPGRGITETGPRVESAAATCRGVIGDPPVFNWTPEEIARKHKEYLAEAECYRTLGYDVEDPGPDEAITLPDGLTDAEFHGCNPGLQ